MLLAIVSNAEVVTQHEDEVKLRFDAAHRAAGVAHLAELKPYFAKAMGRRDIVLTIDGDDEPASADESVQAPPQTQADVDLDHPLIKQVSELFDATPKRVDSRRKG